MDYSKLVLYIENVTGTELSENSTIFCPQCSNWVHCKYMYNGTSKAEFDILSKEDDDLPFHCIVSIIQNNADIFSFGYLSKFEMLDLFGIDMLSQLAMPPSYAVHSKLTKLPHLGDFDMDENMVYSIITKYFEISEQKTFRCLRIQCLCFISILEAYQLIMMNCHCF